MTSAIVVRSAVSAVAHYRDYRDTLRVDFVYSCAYCSMTETEARGLGFEIDHYFPIAAYPQLEVDYAHLMWSCVPCNRRKSDVVPFQKDGQRYHVLRVDEEDPSSHLELKGDRLIASTPLGTFNIELLDLNRWSLVRVREIRRRLFDSEQLIVSGLRKLAKIGLDQMPPRLRMQFQSVKDKLESRSTEIDRRVREYIVAESRSELLEPDDEAEDRTLRRRDYLRGLGALDAAAFAKRHSTRRRH